MRILLLAHTFNSLAQRLFVELRALGHVVSVELDIADTVTRQAVDLFRPEVVIAPILKRAIPEDVWRRVPCLIVHPGIVGDRGPSSLDWAILDRERKWGVTVLQANGEFDAGDVWASVKFALREATKGSVYRNELGAAAVHAVSMALKRFGQRGWPRAQAVQPDPSARGRARPAMRQAVRRIDWTHDGAETIQAKFAASDGSPGVLDTLFGRPCYLFDAHAAGDAALRAARACSPGARAGDVVGRRDGAVLRLTADGALWIGQAKPAWEGAHDGAPFKLPVVSLFPEAAGLQELPAALVRAEDEWAELRYREHDGVGTLEFDFYNGAMSTRQCLRLRDAVAFAKARPIRVLVLAGGSDFFGNGIHLNQIEAAASPADESMRNIEAMDDLVLEVLTASRLVTISALRGNAGAGGAFLALAADEVWAHPGVVLNLHYKNMGNLYGSEYWTYTLPRRLGTQGANAAVSGRLPLGAAQARVQGIVDAVFGRDAANFAARAAERARAIAVDPGLAARLAEKTARRARDEAGKPLASYRAEELARIRRNFYGFDTSYHVARYNFVRKIAQSWTPRHLAVHRDRPWVESARRRSSEPVPEERQPACASPEK